MSTDSTQFQRLRCIKRSDETKDASTFEFEHLDQTPFVFDAGQFLTFEVNYYKKMQYRAYSISSSPAQPNSLSVTIKRVPGGKISNYLIDNLQAGHALPAMAPAGSFTLSANKHSKNLLLMSAGSGITPCLSIARWLLDSQQAYNIHFIHSARSEDDVIMSALLTELAAKHPNFRLTRVLEDTQGRIDATMFAQFIDGVIQPSIFLCGPSQYMQSIESLANETEFDMDYFHKESFVPEAEEGAAVFSDVNYQINVPQHNKKFMINEQQSLLDALHGAGIKIPYSCRSGICGACKCKVSGDVTSKTSEALTKEQIEQGYVLSCSTKANADLIVEI